MITLKELSKRQEYEALILHSLDRGLYQASVRVSALSQTEPQEQELSELEHLVLDQQGMPLRARSLLDMHRPFERLKFKRTILRQDSAYDEMVSHPERHGANRMEIELNPDELTNKR